MSVTPQCPTITISAKTTIPPYQPVLPEPHYGFFEANPTDYEIHLYT
jgi:hypothetical protein